jgi:alkylation response protein AidB-like acyl-CoA dehydrogenase
MDLTIPEKIRTLCDGVRRFMDAEILPLEGRTHWRLEPGGPAYPDVIRAVQQKAEALGYWAFHLPGEAGGAGITCW